METKPPRPSRRLPKNVPTPTKAPPTKQQQQQQNRPTLTVLRLQFSASGSKRKLLSLVKAQSKTSVKIKKEMTVSHCNHPVPPVSPWYEAKAKNVNSSSRNTWSFWRSSMIFGLFVVVLRTSWLLLIDKWTYKTDKQGPCSSKTCSTAICEASMFHLQYRSLLCSGLRRIVESQTEIYYLSCAQHPQRSQRNDRCYANPPQVSKKGQSQTFSSGARSGYYSQQ